MQTVFSPLTVINGETLQTLQVCFQAIISKVFQILCQRTHQNDANTACLRGSGIFKHFNDSKTLAVGSPHSSPRLFASTAVSELEVSVSC